MIKRPFARVFVCDDEVAIADTLTAILRLSGFSAEAFYDPDEALQAAEMECPDLLISDVVMPQISGVALAMQVRVLCPKSKILLFSGQAETASLLRTLVNRAMTSPCWQSPFTPETCFSRSQSRIPAGLSFCWLNIEALRLLDSSPKMFKVTLDAVKLMRLLST